MKSFFFSITLLVAATFFFTGARAQEEIPNKKEAEASKGRTLIVQIEVPNSKTVEKLQKKGKDKALETYQKALEKYNITMKAVVEKYWKFSDKVLYKTPDEITDMIDSKSAGYTILRCATSTIGTGMVSNNGSPGQSSGGSHMTSVSKFGGNLDWSYTELKNENWEDDRDYWNGNTTMEFWRIEKMKKGFMKSPDVVCRIALPEIFPDTASLVYAIQMIQYNLHQSLPHDKTVGVTQQMRLDYASLKTKTIYIRKDRIDPELTLAAIKALYAYPIKIVSKTDFESAIMSAEEGNVFLIIAPQVFTIDRGGPSGGQAMYYDYVFDPTQGRNIATVIPPIGAIYKMGYLGGNAGKPVANEHTFKALNNYMKQLTK